MLYELPVNGSVLKMLSMKNISMIIIMTMVFPAWVLKRKKTDKIPKESEIMCYPKEGCATGSDLL